MDSLDELPSAVRCSTLAVLDSILPSVHSIMMSVVLIRFSVRAASLIRPTSTSLSLALRRETLRRGR